MMKMVGKKMGKQWGQGVQLGAAGRMAWMSGKRKGVRSSTQRDAEEGGAAEEGDAEEGGVLRRGTPMR